MQHTVHAVPAPGRFSKRAVGLLCAGLLQAGMIWVLIEGLDVKVLKTFVDPVRVVFEKDPAKPPPAPPAPRDVMPERVYAPLPPFEIAGARGDSGITITDNRVVPPPTGIADHGPLSVMATHTIPPYPPLELRLGTEGTVFLRLAIGPDGAVIDAQVIRTSGAEGLDRAARLWVIGHWRYQPAIRGGVAVQSAVDVAVKFNLRNAG